MAIKRFSRFCPGLCQGDFELASASVAGDVFTRAQLWHHGKLIAEWKAVAAAQVVERASEWARVANEQNQLRHFSGKEG